MSEKKELERGVLSKILVPVLVFALLVAVFFVGSLSSKVQTLEKGSVPSQTAEKNQQVAVSPPVKQVRKGVASVDDDPVLGDKNAPVTIIEFSDYECPYCKRHVDQTLSQLIKEYVDKGKVKMVYRDFPLSFHEPMASKEAVAANCARKQGGDKKYFEFHDEIFKRTTSNGKGLNDEKIRTIASDLGLNADKFESCLSDPAQMDEVKKDIADGTAAGVSGTPSFVIGKTSSSGEVNGELLVGAQPFSAFKAVIDPLLE